MKTIKVKQGQLQYKDHTQASGSGLVTITEWQNGEGWDVVLNEQHFTLSYSARDALVAALMTLDVEEA